MASVNGAERAEALLLLRARSNLNGRTRAETLAGAIEVAKGENAVEVCKKRKPHQTRLQGLADRIRVEGLLGNGDIKTESMPTEQPIQLRLEPYVDLEWVAKKMPTVERVEAGALEFDKEHALRKICAQCGCTTKIPKRSQCRRTVHATDLAACVLTAKTRGEALLAGGDLSPFYESWRAECPLGPRGGSTARESTGRPC